METSEFRKCKKAYIKLDAGIQKYWKQSIQKYKKNLKRLHVLDYGWIDNQELCCSWTIFSTGFHRFSKYFPKFKGFILLRLEPATLIKISYQKLSAILGTPFYTWDQLPVDQMIRNTFTDLFK